MESKTIMATPSQKHCDYFLITLTDDGRPEATRSGSNPDKEGGKMRDSRCSLPS